MKQTGTTEPWVTEDEGMGVDGLSLLLGEHQPLIVYDGAERRTLEMAGGVRARPLH